MKSHKMNSNTEKGGRTVSILEKLEQLDQVNKLAFKDDNDEAVVKFVNKWQKLVEEYGYQTIMTLEFFKADHPYPEPVFPIKVMDEETYMTLHYSSVSAWSRRQRRPTTFHVIELREEKVIGAINISGPFNEYALFQAFVDICIYTKTLSVIRLISCSLKKEGVMMLAECLPRTRVTHLYLDRNPIPDEDYSSILEKNTVLVHLSLAMCKIGYRGMRALSRVLGPYEGLQPNQRLKSLALDDNNINCLAMKLFAEVNEELHLPIVEIQNQEEDLFEEEEQSLVNLFETSSLQIPTEVDPIRMRVLQQTCDEFLEIDPNPIVANVTLCNGKLIGAGNYTLNVLNISYNKIRERGFICLLRALKEQYLAGMSRKSNDRAFNLKIIEYMGNPCPEDSFIFRKIEYYLKQSNKKTDLEKYPTEPCSCIPMLLSKIDSDTLLLYDEKVDYFEPREETSEGSLSEWECCSEFGEIVYDDSSSDKKAEESQHEEIEEESRTDDEISIDNPISDECKDSTTSSEETDEDRLNLKQSF